MQNQKNCDYCEESIGNLTLTCTHKFCFKCIFKLFLFNLETVLLNFNEEITLKCYLECQEGELKITRRAIHQMCSLKFEENPFCLEHQDALDFQCRNCISGMFENNPPFQNYSYLLDENLIHQYELIQDYELIPMKVKLVEVVTLNYKITRTIYEKLSREFESLKESAYFNSEDDYLIQTKKFCEMSKVEDVLKRSEQSNKSTYKRILKIEDEIDLFKLEQEGILMNFENLRIDQDSNRRMTVGTLTEHTKSIRCLIQLDDLNLASASEDNTIRIWDHLDNFKCVKILTGHSAGICCLIQLKDGTLASGSDDKTIRVWNLKTDTCKIVLSGHQERISCLIQLRDEKLVSASNDMTIRVWNTHNNFECIHVLAGHAHNVRSLIQMKEGNLASASNDKTIMIWDAQNNYNCVKTLEGHTSDVHNLIQLKDGSLASASNDGIIRIWDPQFNYNCVNIIEGHRFDVGCLIQLEDGNLASASNDTTIRIWSYYEYINNCIKSLLGHTSFIHCLIQLKDGKLVSSSYDKTIRIWDNKNNFECSRILDENQSPVECLLQLENGKLVSGSADGIIRVWSKFI